MRESGDDPGLIREGMLGRVLRRLLRPRIEYPLEQVQISQAGDLENRWAPLRVKYATYEAATGELKVIVIGGRVALPGGAVDLTDHIVLITFPSTNMTYWIYLDVQFGTLEYNPSFPPPVGNIEVATVTTPSAWPTTTNYTRHRAQPDYSSLHGLRPSTGDCVVTLSDRKTYCWSGSAWNVLLTVADKRPWFSAPHVPAAPSTPPAAAALKGHFYIPLFMDMKGWDVLNVTDIRIGPVVYHWAPFEWSGVPTIRWKFEATLMSDSTSTDPVTVKLVHFGGTETLATLSTPFSGYGPGTLETGYFTMPDPGYSLSLKVTNVNTTKKGVIYMARLCGVVNYTPY